MGFERAKQLAGKAKDAATGSGGGSDISISTVGDKYLVIDGDNNNYGPYDDRKQAAGKVRELKREQAQTQSSGFEKAKQAVSTGAQKLSDAGEQIAAGAEGQQARREPRQRPSIESAFGLNDNGGMNPTLPGTDGDRGEMDVEMRVDDSRAVPGAQLGGLGMGEPQIPMVDDDALLADGEDQMGEPELPFMSGGIDLAEGPRMPMFGDEPQGRERENTDADIEQRDRYPWMF